MVARHDAADLLFRIARDHDDLVEVVVVAGFEHQRDVGDRDAGRRGKVGEPLADAPVDLGVDDRFQRGACLGVAKDDASEGGTVQRAVGGECAGSAAADLEVIA